MTNTLKRLAAIAATLLAVTGSAHAADIFNADFNDPSFGQGTVRYGNTERWGWGPSQSVTQGTQGWTFQGDVFYVRDANSNNGAILLNERQSESSASHLITGLVAGQTYALSFLMSGDNAQGQNYGLYAWMDSTLVFAEGATVGAPGSSSGSLKTVLFVAQGSSATLKFNEYAFAGSSASPVIDDVRITAVPEPASMALFGTGLLGLIAWRRRPVR